MKSIGHACAALVCLCGSALGAAEESVVEKAKDKLPDVIDLRDRSVAQTGQDPTLVISNAGISYRTNTNADSGSDTNRLVATGAFATKHLSVSGEAPVYVRYNPGSGDTVDGIGDLLVRGQGMIEVQKLRVAGAVEASFNTSTDDLGAQANLITPEIAAGMHLEDRDTITAQVRWSFDAGRESGVDDTDLGELRVGFLSMWDLATFTKFEGRVDRDFSRNENSLIGVADIGRNFDLHHTGWIGTTQPLSRDARDRRGWDLIVTYLYSF